MPKDKTSGLRSVDGRREGAVAELGRRRGAQCYAGVGSFQWCHRPSCRHT
jgi:hypothetical protein